MIPKPEKMYQMNTKCTKWSLNIPDVCKIFQMAIKYINIFYGPPKFTQIGNFFVVDELSFEEVSHRSFFLSRT
jgi:hypothetical protein